MKILLINNFYYNRGGDCTYLFSLKKLLEEKRHKVIIFSMHHPQNFESEYSRYFISYINYEEEVKNKSIVAAIKVFSRTIYSLEAKKKLEILLENEKPDVAHLQNIHHHITPSIFFPLRKYKIPIVWTLHDYTLICPNTSFLSNGKICERCKKIKYIWPPIVRCKKNSLAASVMASIESLIHNLMKSYELIDIFICPSEFLKTKLIEYGFNKNKLIKLNNFFDVCSLNYEKTMGDYYLYVGRLSEEKGIKTLIDAALKIDSSHLKIVGDGPIREQMVLYAKSRDKKNKIIFLGYKDRKEVIDILGKCSFLIIPSECYENFPYAILEAFSCGKPVIGSNIGGIPELVKDNETGLTFEPGNTDDLNMKIKYLQNNSYKILEMGKNARDFAEKELNAEKHYQKLMDIYKQVL
jgi:glycosyltransferase involved in cell wall biosynthesis